MRYCFFDIECACIFKHVAKICAFGYVLTDERFRVLAREDILLDPKGKFHLTDRKGNEGLVLPYAYEEFKNYPPFPAAYRKIKALLEDGETIVLGHATLNDVNYLNLETRRYKLPPFRFAFYDTQFFYMNVQKSFQHQLGLAAMAEELGVEFTPHRAVDDAYATMRVCQALVERERVDGIPALVERYHIQAGRLEGGRISPLRSDGLESYLAARDEARDQRARRHETFYRYVNKHMHRRAKEGALAGKVFCFSKEVEEEVPMSVRLVAAIFASGGAYTSRPGECNVYIARGQGGVRYQNALSAGAAFVPLERLECALEGL